MFRVLLILCASLLVAAAAVAKDTREAVIGLPILFEEVVIDGSEVEGLPLDPKAPFHARVVAVRPHGSALRYDIEITAFEAGTFDAVEGLRRKDGTQLAGVAPLSVVVRSKLAAGLVRPTTPGAGHVPNLGGYRTWLIVAGVVWILGLVWFWLTGRRRHRVDATASTVRTPSLVERLTVLVERARAGRLTDAERSQLEMSLVAHWRKRLALESKSASELLPILRAHAEAGPLLCGLEKWLHAPGGADAAEVASLLAPYRGLAQDEIDLPRIG